MPTPLKLANTFGEVICPRKSNPLPATIAVQSCRAMHDDTPERCANHRCQHHLLATQEADELVARNNMQPPEVDDG
jgi:hypothetical protein